MSPLFTSGYVLMAMARTSFRRDVLRGDVLEVMNCSINDRLGSSREVSAYLSYLCGSPLAHDTHVVPGLIAHGFTGFMRMNVVLQRWAGCKIHMLSHGIPNLLGATHVAQPWINCPFSVFPINACVSEADPLL